MIHRDGFNGPITFECDSCNQEVNTHENDFRDALESIKKEGWKVKKIENDWFHFCSFNCQKQTSRENRKLPEVNKMKREDALAWFGLSDTATVNDIKITYQRLIKLCHPDKGGTTALAQLLNNAYDTLKVPF